MAKASLAAIPGWYPVASLRDLADRHLFHTRLLGDELVVWRDNSGKVNAWSNRCPHRGARLSIGSHLGTSLRCRYHGLEFASGDGGCIRIPAIPEASAPDNLRTEGRAVHLALDLVWVGKDAALPFKPPLDPGVPIETIRAIHVHAPHSEVDAALMEESGWNDDFLFITQPATDDRSIVHGVLRQHRDTAALLSTLRLCNTRLTQIRDRLEAGHNAPPVSRNPFGRIEPAA